MRKKWARHSLKFIWSTEEIFCRRWSLQLQREILSLSRQKKWQILVGNPFQKNLYVMIKNFLCQKLIDHDTWNQLRLIIILNCEKNSCSRWIRKEFLSSKKTTNVYFWIRERLEFWQKIINKINLGDVWFQILKSSVGL